MTRILIVEDEAALAEPLAFLLGREGYETSIAPDGQSSNVTTTLSRATAGGCSSLEGRRASRT